MFKKYLSRFIDNLNRKYWIKPYKDWWSRITIKFQDSDWFYIEKWLDYMNKTYWWHVIPNVHKTELEEVYNEMLNDIKESWR